MSRPYARYRDSGVEWLGEVPEHWEVRPFQRALRESLKYGANEAAELDDPGLPRFVRITDIGEIGRLRDETFRSLPIELAEPYLLESGDLLFARSGSVGRTFLYDESWGSCAYAGYLIRARVDHAQVMPEFISYFSASQSYMHWLRTVAIQATIENVSAERYSRMPIPVPPLDEQRAIAAFLGRETERIDALVERKRRLIERLREYRNALITRTVTRGLPPAAARAAGLDPSPRLKPSGVEWLGDVPEYWVVARLKWSSAGTTSGVWGDEPDGENDIACVRVADFDRRGFRVSFDDPTLRAISPSQRIGRELRARDLLLEKSGGGEKQLVGCVVLFDHDEPAVSSNFIARIATVPGGDPGFWTYVHAALYSGKLNYLAIKQTTGIQNLDLSVYFDTLVGFPPLLEQEAIARYLERETAAIDKLHGQVESAIERLQEHRTALITAAVTGKIDVREAAPEPVAAT